MELKVKGKSVTSSKVKKFQNPFCFKLEIINNKIEGTPILKLARVKS